MQISEKDKWIRILNEVSSSIIADETANSSLAPKGIIVADDPDGAILGFVKNELKYSQLVASKKVEVLNIDQHWSMYMRCTEEYKAKELWNILVNAANHVRNGLLVLNISNLETFKFCWHLKQLAKQERELQAWCNDEILDTENGILNIEALEEKTQQMLHQGQSEDEVNAFVDATLEEASKLRLGVDRVDFKGYVLLNIQDISWDEVMNYANQHNSGQFDAMMHFYRRIVMK